MRGCEKRLANGLKWIGLIIAAMVGAGYASGREIWEFFGHESGLAILIFTVLFIISCQVILKLSYEMKTAHYLPVLKELLGGKMSRIYDVGIFFYLFMTFFVMISGSGATFSTFGVPNFVGIAFIVIFLLAIVPFGMGGIITINRVMSPVLIIGLASVLLYFAWDHHVSFFSNLTKQSNWASSIPFTSLNILPLVAILGAIGKEIKSKKEIYIASIGSGLILGGTSFLYNTNLIHVADQLIIYEMPLFAVLHGYPMILFVLMSVLLWFAIYTTAMTNIFSLLSRLRETIKLKDIQLSIIIIIFALPFTFFGFRNLISYLYPLYGVINLYILAAILIYPILKRADIRNI